MWRINKSITCICLLALQIQKFCLPKKSTYLEAPLCVFTAIVNSQNDKKNVGNQTIDVLFLGNLNFYNDSINISFRC